jgi:hypothetical protein
MCGFRWVFTLRDISVKLTIRLIKGCCLILILVGIVEGYREVKRETAELYIPEPGKRIHYLGSVIKVERFIPQVKALRINGVVRYGSIQIVLPRDCVGKPVYVVAYVINEVGKLGSEVISEDQFKLRGRTPIIRVTW